MKKVLAMILAGVMLVAAVGCGNKAGNETGDNGAADNTPVAASALEILETVWSGYGDDEKFPISGGDSSNMTMDVPGVFDATNSEELDVTLGFPAAQAGLIDDAASMVHMMNLNTFTCGVYHVTDAANAATLADAIKENISVRQWMCGMPEKLLIANLGGDYVLAAFGMNDVMDVFKTNLTAAYEGTTVVYEEAITE